MEIGMRSAALREERDWKKTQFARRLGISCLAGQPDQKRRNQTLSSDMLIEIIAFPDKHKDTPCYCESGKEYLCVCVQDIKSLLSSVHPASPGDDDK